MTAFTVASTMRLDESETRTRSPTLNFTSHFYIVVFLTQLIGGSFMFANRYVPFGLLLLGPVLVNILSFHTFMAPGQISLALVATVLWFIVFFQVRNAFSGVFVRSVASTV